MNKLSAAEYRQTLAVANAKPASGTGVHPAVVRVTTGLKRKAAKHDEDDLQRALFRWFAYQYPEWRGHFWATPNGGARSKATAAILKATGVMPGVADCQLAIVRPHAAGLFLELKVGRNKPSDAQRDFLTRMEAQGYATAVAYDFNAARAAIVNHIGY